MPAFWSYLSPLVHRFESHLYRPCHHSDRYFFWYRHGAFFDVVRILKMPWIRRDLRLEAGNFAWKLETKQWRAVAEKQICEITWLLTMVTQLVKWQLQLQPSQEWNEIGLTFTFKHHSNNLSFTPLSSGHQTAILFLECLGFSQWQQKSSHLQVAGWWSDQFRLMLKPIMNLQEFLWCQIPCHRTFVQIAYILIMPWKVAALSFVSSDRMRLKLDIFGCHLLI